MIGVNVVLLSLLSLAHLLVLFCFFFFNFSSDFSCLHLLPLTSLSAHLFFIFPLLLSFLLLLFFSLNSFLSSDTSLFCFFFSSYFSFLRLLFPLTSLTSLPSLSTFPFGVPHLLCSSGVVLSTSDCVTAVLFLCPLCNAFLTLSPHLPKIKITSFFGFFWIFLGVDFRDVFLTHVIPYEPEEEWRLDRKAVIKPFNHYVLLSLPNPCVRVRVYACIYIYVSIYLYIYIYICVYIY